MRLLFAILSGCACPSFDEMNITFPNAEREGELRPFYEATVGMWVEWTGREGVCVSQVQVGAELSGAGAEAGFVEEYVAWGGPGTPLQVRDEASTSDIWHGLCHALDAHEGLSRLAPDLFPRGPRPSIFEPGGVSAAEEAFANACNSSPRDLAVPLAVDAACGTTDVTNEERFRNAFIYPALGSDVPVHVGAAPAPFAWVESGDWAGSSSPLQATADGDRIVVLVDEVLGEEAFGVRLARLDPETFAPVDTVEILLDAPVSEVMDEHVLLPADEGVWVATWGFGTMDIHLWHIDGTSWREVTIDTGGLEDIDGGVVRDGALLALVDNGDGELFVAWDLATGTRSDLPMDGLEDVYTGYVQHMSAAPDGGIDVLFDAVFARFDGAAWATWRTPGEVRGLGRPTPTTRLFVSDDYPLTSQPLVLDLETGEWTLHATCDDDTLESYSSAVDAGGATFLLDASFRASADGERRVFPIARWAP